MLQTNVCWFLPDDSVRINQMARGREEGLVGIVQLLSRFHLQFFFFCPLHDTVSYCHACLFGFGADN